MGGSRAHHYQIKGQTETVAREFVDEMIASHGVPTVAFQLIVETRRKIVNVVGNCESCRPAVVKILSSGKFFGLSEKISGLPEKYCPWPRLKHWSHGATAFQPSC